MPPTASVAACVGLALAGLTSELLIAIAPVLLVVGIYFGLHVAREPIEKNFIFLDGEGAGEPAQEGGRP